MSNECNIRRWDLLKGQLRNLKVGEVEQFLLDHPDTVLIDCRQPKEFDMVRFPQAINYDYLAYDFWEKVNTLPKDQTYLVYCNTCRRSTRSCTLMKNGGFTEVYNLEGGLKAWVDTFGDEALVRGAKVG